MYHFNFSILLSLKARKALNLVNSTNIRDVDIIGFLAYQLVVRVHYKMNCV